MLPSQYLEKGWTQGTFARDKDGNPVNEYNSSALCWCASGAISAAFPMSYEIDLAVKLTKEIEKITKTKIVLWNDDEDRTHEEVIYIVREAEKILNIK